MSILPETLKRPTSYCTPYLILRVRRGGTWPFHLQRAWSTLNHTSKQGTNMMAPCLSPIL